MTLPSEMLEESPVILCLGSGGVGKTTTAAALALCAAQRGQRAVVLTIDPARRLADAMGLGDSGQPLGRVRASALSNDARQIAGPWPGELWAAMLDPGETFDGLIRFYAETEEQAERIIGNRLYKNLTETLSGTNEYMAAERLRELHLDDRFDIVIVDTPPAKHALDFLDSPSRITRFFDHRLYRSVLAPRKGVRRVVNSATQLMMKTIGRFVGTDFLVDVVDFFAAFEGIDQGFRDRAAEVESLLASPKTSCVIVTAARYEPLQEAEWISSRLRDRGQEVSLLLVNRLTPRFDLPETEPLHAGPAAKNHSELGQLATAEEVVVDELAQQVGAETVLMVYELLTPVSDLAGLGELAEQLRDATYIDP